MAIGSESRMFEWDVSKKGSRLRFSTIFAASVAVHVILLITIFGLYAYERASQFALISLEDDPNYTNRIAVADPYLKPLILPPKFYAPKEAKRLDELKKDKPKPEPRADKDAKDAKGTTDGTAPEASSDAKPAPPSDTPLQFGRIEENALRPHLRAVYV